jgi:hypothetical protein
VLFVGGVALARDRRRALLRGALGVVASMVLLGVALAVMRSMYVSETPADILTAEAAGGVFDTLVRFLRNSVRALAVLGLLVALAAFLAGPSTAAMRTRQGFTGGIGSLRGGAEAGGWRAGPVAAWTYRHRQALRVTFLTAGGLALVFWSQPTAWVVVGVALVIVLLLALVEVLAVPPAPGPAVEAAEAEPSAAAPAVPRQRPGPVQPSTPLQPTEKE